MLLKELLLILTLLQATLGTDALLILLTSGEKVLLLLGALGGDVPKYLQVSPPLPELHPWCCWPSVC